MTAITIPELPTTETIGQDEVARYFDEIIHAGYRFSSKFSPLLEGRRKRITRMASAISYGFEPVAVEWTWSDDVYGLRQRSAHRAICSSCGHSLSISKSGWMRKHARGHGIQTGVSLIGILSPKVAV